MSAPKNVFWFEILLYAALTLDALSVALQDRGTLSVDIVTTAMSVEGALILVCTENLSSGVVVVKSAKDGV